MNRLYLIERIGRAGWDEYDSAVVCAAEPNDALNTHPENSLIDWNEMKNNCGTWVRRKEDVKITLLGNACEELPIGVVCASFNAG